MTALVYADGNMAWVNGLRHPGGEACPMATAVTRKSSRKLLIRVASRLVTGGLAACYGDIIRTEYSDAFRSCVTNVMPSEIACAIIR